MATHFSILAWKKPMYRGAWMATVHCIARSWADWATKHTGTRELEGRFLTPGPPRKSPFSRFKCFLTLSSTFIGEVFYCNYILIQVRFLPLCSFSCWHVKNQKKAIAFPCAGINWMSMFVRFKCSYIHLLFFIEI